MPTPMYTGCIPGSFAAFSRTLCHLLAVLLLAIVAPGPLYAASYYVDAVNGNDGNSGTDESAAWKSMSRVESYASSGDTIIILSVQENLFSCRWPTGFVYRARGVTQFGITWVFDAHYRIGRYANGDFWVLGPVNIVGFSPACATVDSPVQDGSSFYGRVINGSMINPPAAPYNGSVPWQGYDSATAGYSGALNVAKGVTSSSPLAVSVSDHPIKSIVSTISLATVPTSAGLPRLSDAAILTVVAEPPASDAFRPPYCGSNKIDEIQLSDVNWAPLRSLTPVPGTVPLSTCEQYFQRPWLEHATRYPNSTIKPVNNMPYYARDGARRTVYCALHLNLNHSQKEKEVLLTRFLQYGIDNYGVVDAGGVYLWYGGGSVGNGKKLPILYAAVLLNHPKMLAMFPRTGQHLYSNGYGPGPMSGWPPDYIEFTEDSQVHYVTQADVNWTNGPDWDPDSRDAQTYPYDTNDIGLPEWGISHGERPWTNNNWWPTLYRQISGCNMPGTALAVYMINAKDIWNHPAFFDYCDRFMYMVRDGGPFTDWQLGTNGIDLTAANRFSWNMWHQYRSEYGHVWTYDQPNDVSGNSAPVLSPLGDRVITQGQTVVFTIAATDADSDDTLEYSVSALPGGATFTERTFTWTPAADQVGSYQVTFTVSDGQAQDSEAVTITVEAAPVPNSPPVLAGIGDKSVREDETLSFSVSGTDPDDGEDTLVYSATGLPRGANFAGRTFTWTPSYDQAGSYQVTFVVSDGRASDSQTVTISVANVNRPPMLNGITDRSVDTGNTLAFSVSGLDPDGDSLTYSASGVPTGASFTGQNFSWTPATDQAGSYALTFQVSDGQDSDSRTVTVTVLPPAPDTTAPVVARCAPAPDSIQVPTNSLMTLHITDAGSGVDPASVVIQANGQTVYQGNQTAYTSATGRCSRSGDKNDYRFIYQADQMSDFDWTMRIQVNATDLDGNVMSAYSYSYVTEMRSFGANKQISRSVGFADKSRPATASDAAGNLWAVWHEGPQGARDIYVAWCPAGADAFVKPLRLTKDSQDQCNPDIAAGTDGKVYVTWQDNRRGNWDIFVSVGSAGQDFSREVLVADSDLNEVNPAIIVDRQSPNRVCIAWQDDRNGNQDIYVAGSANAFASSTVSQVTTDMADQTAPDLAVVGQSTICVVWTDMRNGQADIYGAASDAGPWTNVPVVTGAGDQTEPAVAAEPGGDTLHLLWVDDASGNQDIYYASSAGMPGTPLTGNSIIDDTSGADQAAPAILCAGSGKVFACWQDSRHVDVTGGDTDLYFTELSSGTTGTNILVGDGNTSADQSEPAMGVDGYGQPYIVWTDGRSQNTEIYYAASTFIDPQPLDSKMIAAPVGGTIGTDPTAISKPGDVSIVVPPGACQADMRVVISRVRNPQGQALQFLGSYDFGPSGIDFDRPVTVTVPYQYPGKGKARPYWYDSLTGALSQQGITDIENITLSSDLNALRFKTTHFTPFYIVAGTPEGTTLDGSGDLGAGCSISATGAGSPKELVVPYAVIALVIIVLRRRDRRKRRLLDAMHEPQSVRT